MGGVFWRIARWLIRWQLWSAARTVLTSYSLHMADGLERRWLKGESDLFQAETEQMAQTIRPLARLDELPTVGNRLMVELAVYTASAYRALIGLGVEAESARTVTADIGWTVYARLLRLTSLPVRLITRDPGRRLRGTIAILLRFPFSAPGAPGYAASVFRDGEDILTHFTHCPPQSFVRELVARTEDKEDLEAFYQSWCKYDWPGADIIAGDGARGHYRRSQTLSRGDPECDMCWRARAIPDA